MKWGKGSPGADVQLQSKSCKGTIWGLQLKCVVYVCKVLREILKVLTTREEFVTKHAVGW